MIACEDLRESSELVVVIPTIENNLITPHTEGWQAVVWHLLVSHPLVSESAVVGYPHKIKGQGIYAFVTLMVGENPTKELTRDLEAWVRKEIGPIAKPDLIQWSPNLPKTRSGKIMRRILRKIAENKYEDLGDTSTLADPTVVNNLIENRLNK